MISLVVACSLNKVIGNNNKLPWHISRDLKRFKELTKNKIVVMGRKTYESIGHPLIDRTNIVLTRKKDYDAPGCIIKHSIDSIMFDAIDNNINEIFFIGGQEIYNEALEICDTIYLTMINKIIPGDTFFPLKNFNNYYVTDKINVTDDDNVDFTYSFLVLERKVDSGEIFYN